MARLPAEQLARIKSEVSLLRLVEGEGYEVTRQGKDYVIRCPFHEEDTPSLIISPKSNLFHCFGCEAAGSVIDWVMQTQNISFRHAVEILQQSNPSLAAQPVPAKHTVKPKLDALPLNQDDQALLHQVADYYHETLLQSPEALAYLEKRGLHDPELIKRFKLGYANRTLGYRLPPKRTKAGDALRGQLTKIGLYRESGHEHFNGSVVVPILDEQGNVVEAYGRKTRDDLRKGTPKHLYLPGPHAGVWNTQGLENQKEVILCEALIDAMTFWCAGYKNVTASYGTGGFTDHHLAAFKQYGIERFLIAYDRDESGNQAAEKLAKQLQQAGFDCYRLNFPKGMDANAYACEVQPASKSLGVVIRSAEWMGKGVAPERIPTEAIPEPPAQALPDAPASDLEAVISDQEVIIEFGNRRYRIRGLEKNRSYEVLKVNVLVSNESGCDGQDAQVSRTQGCVGAIHVDTFDLYSAKHRQGFIKVAAMELGVEERVIKTDLGQVLLKLEELQEQQIEGDKTPAEKIPVMSEAEQQAALSLLRDPKLLNRILTDFSRCGVVGEETNKLVGYLAASSRKLDRPLAVIIQSTSAAGKSSLMDAILNLMPEAERVQYSAMTGQSLFYMGETNLKHKILAIAEEEGAEQASYALKLLQSEGVITIASTGKDEDSGDLVTKEYKVEGPVMLFLTTTAIDIDEELLNRCLVLTVNESREQTRAIHEAQRRRRTLEGLQGQLEKTQLAQLHRNAQQLLKPLAVINPYADQLTFLDDKTRTRRDHEKYLTLIDSIALLHQYQREVKNVEHNGQVIEYIEVQLSDIDTANRLAHEVLGRTLDELPPQTRKLLKLIQAMVTEQCQVQGLSQTDYRFSRRDVREFTGWSDGQLKIHCTRLTDLEYLLVHRGGRGQHLVYELLFDGDGSNASQLMGLIDTEKLAYDVKKSGQKMQKVGLSQAQVSPKSGQVKPLKGNNGKALKESRTDISESTSNGKNASGPYRSRNALPLAAQPTGL